MHSPNLITPVVAAELIGAQTAAASSSRRAARHRSAGVFGRFRRRPGASRPLVPRGRSVPPLAH
jgi:hypothetical protein